MTKLNHDRPQLRYLDNLRRELARQERTATQVEEDLGADSEVLLPKEIFPLLDSEAAAVAIMLDAVSNHFDVEDEILKAISRGGASVRLPTPAHVSARKRADAKMHSAAQKLAECILQSALQGRMNLVALFKDMEYRLDPFLWDLINTDLLKSAFQRLAAPGRTIT